MARPIILFHGGTCDGLRITGQEGVTPDATFTCAGTVYSVFPTGADTYIAELPGVAAPPPPATTTGTPSTSTSPEPLDGGLHEAWHAFSVAAGRTVPRTINAIPALRAKLRAAGKL